MEIFLDTLKWSAIVGTLALVLALLRPAFEKRYSARWRYWLWLALAALALLAPVQWGKLLPSAPAVHTPVVIDVPELELQVIRGDRVSVALRPVSSGIPSAAQRTWQLDKILPAVWLAGAAAFALYALAGTWLFRCRARRWGRTPNENTQRIYESVQRDMRLKKAPPLYVSSKANSPMLAGLLNPCLLLPNEDWNERELSFILCHELTHYKRHDLWYKLVLLAANALHWFNPMMYLLVRESSVDLELTCDDEVVFGESRETRRAYSETLLSAVRRNKGLGTALSTNFYGGKEVMKERFRNILGKQGRKWGAAALVLALLAAMVSACAVGVKPTETAEPKGEQKPEPEKISSTENPESQTEPGVVQEHIDRQIAHLAERGLIVTDQRSKLTMVDTYIWDVYDSEMQVWKLEYALKLENPEECIPVGGEELDADGWLSGLDSQGEPHFIFSVYKGEEPAEIQYMETAYSNVEWEYGYTWEEYVFCHTLFGLDLAAVLNGWPNVSTEFLQSMADGHETWAMDWEDVAHSYLDSLGVKTEGELYLLSVLKGNETHDEARMVDFRTDSGRTGTMLLTHIVYPVETWNTTLNFWQVTGFVWQDERNLRYMEGIMQEFLDAEAAGDADKVIEMEHFENNWESGLKHETIENGQTIKNYKILSGEEVGLNLYAFAIQAVLDENRGPEVFYNFVLYVDDGYHVACNIANIPAEVSNGTDLSRFDVDKDDPNVLGRPDEDGNGNLTGLA